MTEQVWRHRFVQALFLIIKKETGLGDNKCYELAFEEVGNFWRDKAQFETPEEAAQFAFASLKS